MDQANPNPSNANAQPGASRSNLVVIAAVVAVIAIVVVAVAVLATGGDDEAEQAEGAEEASGCLAELAQRLPEDMGAVEAANLVVARANGYDDSSVEAMIDSSIAVSTSPDPLTRQFVFQRMETDVEMPYRPFDVDCWVGDLRNFAISGNFDRDRFANADSRVANQVVLADDNRLAVSAWSLLEDSDDGDTGDDRSTLLAQAVGALGSDTSYSRLIPGRVGGEDGGAWIGSGLAPEDSSWSVTTVWAYADPAVAEEAEPLLRELLAGGQSQYSDLVEGDPSADLTRDGGVLRVRSRLSGEPQDWYALLNRLDAILLFDPRS